MIGLAGVSHDVFEHARYVRETGRFGRELNQEHQGPGSGLLVHHACQGGQLVYRIDQIVNRDRHGLSAPASGLPEAVVVGTKLQGTKGPEGAAGNNPLLPSVFMA